MGEIAYFKKRDPRTPFYPKDAKPIYFNAIIGDFGYAKTDNQKVIDAFRAAIKEQVGGISEITEQDYQVEFLEKKHLSSDRPPHKDRESIGGPSGDALLARHAAKDPRPSQPAKSPEPEPEKVQSVSSKPLADDKKPVAAKAPARKG